MSTTTQLVTVKKGKAVIRLNQSQTAMFLAICKMHQRLEPMVHLEPEDRLARRLVAELVEQLYGVQKEQTNANNNESENTANV